MTYSPKDALARFREKFQEEEIDQSRRGQTIITRPIARATEWLETELLLAYKKGREDTVEYVAETVDRVKEMRRSLDTVDWDYVFSFALDAASQSGESDLLQ